MKPSPGRAVALLVFIFLVAMPAAAGTGGYSAAPAPAGALPGNPQDPVPISFGDLTVRQMIIAISLSFCPVLVYPVEIFFYLKAMAALGYRKVEQNAIRWNRNRQKIYDCIAANPGLKFHSLEHLTGMKEGTLKYHLLILSMKRRIVTLGSGRSMRYFENNGRYNEREKKVFIHLQNATTRRILEILVAYPEVSRKEIAESVGITGPSISWHMKQLAGDGIITTCQKWRAVRYTLCPAVANILRSFRELQSGRSEGCAATGESLGK